MANRWRKKWKQWQILFSWAPKSVEMMTAAMKLKDACSLKKSYNKCRQHIKSRSIALLTKVCPVKAMVFLVVMYGCESWTIKMAEHWKTDAFELWYWRRLLRIPWIAKWSNQSILKEINHEYSALISFRIDWLDLLAVQGTLKSLLQHHSSKASILWHSAIFMVQLSHPYMTTGEIIALTRQNFVGQVMSLLFNMLPNFVLTFLPRSKCLGLVAEVTIHSDFGAQENILFTKNHTHISLLSRSPRPMSYMRPSNLVTFSLHPNNGLPSALW